MSDRMCASPVIRGTEFEVLSDPVTGTDVRRFGTCGPRASASALSSALGHVVTLEQVYSYMREHGLCDESGASTSSENIQVCVDGFGAGVAENAGFHDISTGGWASWLDFFRAHAGIDPIVFETSDGQALVDSISGLGENATNLQYHFPCAVAYHRGGTSDVAGGRTLPEGFWVADGDNFAGGNSNANNFQALNVLQFYTVEVISAAKLVAGFALKGRNTMLELSQTMGFFVAQADGSWWCPEKQHWVKGGNLATYRNMVGLGNLNGLSDLGLPISEEIPVGSPKAGSQAQPTIQVFERGVLAYDPDRMLDNPPGVVGYSYKTHLDLPQALAVIAPQMPETHTLTVGTPTVTKLTDLTGTVTMPYTITMTE